MTISFLLSVELFLIWQRNWTKSCQRPLKYIIVTAIVTCGKWSSLEPHSLLIALLDWTIKQKRQIRNMGYVICVRICSISRLFLCSKSWYRAKRDCKIINNVETVSSDKEKKKQYVGFWDFGWSWKFSDHFLFPYFFNLHSILHLQFLHLF